MNAITSQLSANSLAAVQSIAMAWPWSSTPAEPAPAKIKGPALVYRGWSGELCSIDASGKGSHNYNAIIAASGRTNTPVHAIVDANQFLRSADGEYAFRPVFNGPGTYIKPETDQKSIALRRHYGLRDRDTHIVFIDAAGNVAGKTVSTKGADEIVAMVKDCGSSNEAIRNKNPACISR